MALTPFFAASDVYRWSAFWRSFAVRTREQRTVKGRTIAATGQRSQPFEVNHAIQTGETKKQHFIREVEMNGIVTRDRIGRQFGTGRNAWAGIGSRSRRSRWRR
jgi:hypothetical protein